MSEITISAAEHRSLVRYTILGTPEEVEKKIRELETDNKTQRDEIRTLKESQPAEGSVVLPKEQADKLAAYEKLGKPDELAIVATERDELRQKDAARVREDAFRAAAKAMGWPEDTALTLLDMRSLDGAVSEVKTETVEGKEVQVPYITLAGDDAKPQKLADFAASAPQLKGLKTDAAEERKSTPFPPQEKGGSKAENTDGGVKDAIKAIQDRARAPNSLRPAKAT